ncbi:MAG: NAD-dependent protein deacylase, partial [Gammaproteobacteria bacterium]|nr:NAD-dependent protein deacylase [Gammaproteobacteria bacterium]
GLWSRYNPLDLATPEAFTTDPALIWRWYRWRRDIVANVDPNPGHFAIAALQQYIPQLTLVTQNVDNLHQRAGSTDVIEFHGNLFEDRCLSDGSLHVANDDEIPACPHCGGPLRPGVVWFGETIPDRALEDSCAAATDCDVFLSIGTSSAVYPAAGLADLARQNGASIAEINPNPTPHADGFDFIVAGKSGLVLPELINLLAL